MNWRKGMFRLWMAVSVLWIIGVGWFAWMSYPALNTYKVHTIGKDGKLVSHYDFDKPVKEGLNRGIIQIVQFPDGVEILVNTEWSGKKQREHVIKVHKILETSLQKRRSRFLSDKWMIYLGWTISAPIFLLMIGSGVGWILTGFRR